VHGKVVVGLTCIELRDTCVQCVESYGSVCEAYLSMLMLGGWQDGCRLYTHWVVLNITCIIC